MLDVQFQIENNTPQTLVVFGNKRLVSGTWTIPLEADIIANSSAQAVVG